MHPSSGDGGRGGHVEEAVTGEKKGRVRIKVRMRRDQLEELLYVARRRDQSDGGNKIGFLILKECMEGRLSANVLGSGDDASSQRCGNYLVSRRLGSIIEE